MEALKKFLKSQACKEIIRLIAALLAGYAGSGCSALPADHASLDVIECKAAVVAPYVGDLAYELVRDIDGNRAFNPVEYFLAQGLTPKEILALIDQYQACAPQAEAPATLEKG